MEGSRTAPLDSAIDNLEQPPPTVEPEVAARAARELFGLNVSVARPLPGERDRNFLLVAGEQRYVMKVVHPAEDPAVSEFQARLLTHLRNGGIPVQTVVEPLAGVEPILSLADSHGSGSDCRVRCVTYLPGRPLIDVEPSVARWRALGRFMAEVDDVLADVAEPDADRPLLWDIQRADELSGLVTHIADANRRRAVTAILDEFVDQVRPQLRRLRRQVIHNDGNPQNVLLALHDADRIGGVIDFGDAVHAPIVQELAVAISYQPLACAGTFTAAREVARGYHAEHPLDAAELALIPALVATRLALTTVITAWRSALHPENAAYIMRNDRTIAANLEIVAGRSDRDGVARFVASVLDGEQSGSSRA